MSTIGTDAWIQNMIKAATNNRANQMNPNCPAYWASRNQPVKPQPNPFVAAAVAATLGAAVTAATIWGVQKIVRMKKEQAEDEETEEVSELEKIEIEGPESGEQ